MSVGFIGLGQMGFPMAARLVSAGHELVVFDTRTEVVERAVALGATGARSPKEVADRAETVMASLPSLHASRDVVAGAEGVVEGAMVRTFLDFSTIGSRIARLNHQALSARGIAALDCPVSGGVSGATNGTLAVMVSGPNDAFDCSATIIETLGRPIYIGDNPGAAQTMKLVNNLMAAATLAATAEVIVMGVKAGLDPRVMIDVLNAGSGATHASRDKFPRSVLPRTFDFGFATGLMVKDIRLYLEEAASLGLHTPVSGAVGELWEEVLKKEGPESDFTSVVKPLESAAEVIVDGRAGSQA